MVILLQHQEDNFKVALVLILLNNGNLIKQQLIILPLNLEEMKK
jgi:hypothetical protein